MPSTFGLDRLELRIVQVVERGQQLVGGAERIDAGIRPGGVGGAPFHPHFQMQAAVMRDHDVVGEAGADGEVGLADPLLQQPARPDQAAGLLVIGQVQFDRTAQRQAAFLKRLERESVSREVGFGNRHATAIHDAVADFSAIGVRRPALARRDDIAMRVERHDRTGAELAADDEVGGADHAVGLDQIVRHVMTLDRETQLFKQFGRALGMGGAVARRIVRRYLDQLRQELDLGLVLLVDVSADLVLLVRRHDVPHGF